MKPILILCGAMVAAAIAFFVWQTISGEDHFGKAFTGLPPAAITDLATRPADFLGKPVSIHGKLQRQCPSTGCWFFLVDPADPKAQAVKVEMGDTTPKLPQRLGQTAHVEGQLIKYGDGYEFIGVAVTFEKEPRS